MMTERENTTKALKYAIQMEIDGKTLYLKASRESGNELGKKLMESLAEQEDFHRQKFKQIYENIRRSRQWPVVDFKSDAGRSLRTIFAKEIDKTESKITVTQTELDDVQRAMEWEDKSYDLYHQRYQQAAKDAEKNFYETITAEERQHKLVLLDYYEYLHDPAAWFVKVEHPSLDGGV